MSMASVACPIVGQELLKGCSCSCLSPTSKISCASSAGQVVFLDLSSALTDQAIEETQLYCDECPANGQAYCAISRPEDDSPNSSSSSQSSGLQDRHECLYGWTTTASCELASMIKNQMQRESEMLPCADYLSRPVSPQQQDGKIVTPQMRAIVISWLAEVANEFRMQQETLFQGVALFDRFQACSPAGVPRDVLQLVATGAIMTASKQDEVSHPSVDDFTEIAADAFKREDLLRMERLLLDQLDWCVQLPTSYGFLHLLTQALKGCLHQRTIALSAYLSELALLDYSMLRHPPSLVASAALVVGVACFGSGDAEARAAMRGLDEVTGYSTADLASCAGQLLHLHQCASIAEAAAAYQPFAFIRDKYAQEVSWLSISRYDLSGTAVAAVMTQLGLAAGMPQQH